MAGAYAHITVVNHAQKLARTALRSAEVKYALAMNLRYLELGAVSPDYPYLATGQSHWADDMHCTRNASLLKSGIANLQQLAGIERERATGWLFGFASHMATDMTVHPVVERLVGPWQDNKAAHRQCEMHQDAFIFQKLDLGDVGLTEHLRSGIASCVDPDDRNKLDPTIAGLWLQMLRDTYPMNDGRPRPAPDGWHRGFADVLGAVNVDQPAVPVRAPRRHQPEPHLSGPERGRGSVHPEPGHARGAAGLRAGVPAGLHQRGRRLVPTGRRADRPRPRVPGRLKDWNLDTGRAVADANYVFWRQA